ncbi:hypothetical protein DY000_02020160 [Brassica cretica]|uniref:Uncharacterized protein n=1 Tax=Brassica cretica TaxID=69181 RepID=A0ABQ7ECY8_BRACR|nr:hypothetical protein DY000_02020160 [Brassica cretica]
MGAVAVGSRAPLMRTGRLLSGTRAVLDQELRLSSSELRLSEAETGTRGC